MPGQHNEDDVRMIRLQEGEPEAFDEIMSAWQGPLFGFFMRRTKDVQRSEDLVQETLLRLYRKAWNYLPTGAFRGWLFRIANNLLIDNVRKRSSDALIRRVTSSATADGEAMSLLDLMPDGLVSSETKASNREIAELVDELLSDLPDEQRQTFMLHHYESLTLSEVATAMKTNLPTAKSRLRLAKEKLRYQLSCRGIAETALLN